MPETKSTHVYVLIVTDEVAGNRAGHLPATTYRGYHRGVDTAELKRKHASFLDASIRQTARLKGPALQKLPFSQL